MITVYLNTGTIISEEDYKFTISIQPYGVRLSNRETRTTMIYPWHKVDMVEEKF